MFRFYRITTFLEGSTYVDFSRLNDWQDVKNELEAGGPLEGRQAPYGRFPYQDFIIYESA